jgi:NTP pyrophosphatase (non-canonical NTP hydrolase)
MRDQDTSVQSLKDAFRRFVAERQWEPFHSPKNLAMCVAVEAAELMEHFLWVDAAASSAVCQEPERLAQVAEEIADVAGCLFNLCNALDIDLSSTIEAKLRKNAQKYPVQQYCGRYEAKDASGSGREGGQS